MGIGIVKAQQPRPPSAAQTIIYPAAVQLTAEVPALNSTIERVRLFIQIPDAETQIIELTPAQAILPDPEPTLLPDAPTPTPSPIPADPRTTLTYLYLLDADALPRLFDTVQVVWEVTLDDGEQIIFESDFIFQDARLIWRLIDDPRDRLDIYVPSGDARIDPIAPELRLLYDLLSDITDTTPPLRWMLYLGIEDYLCIPRDDELIAIWEGIVAPCSNQVAEAIFTRSGIMPIRYNETILVTARQYLVDLLFDTFFADRWAGRDVPPWFDQALRRFLNRAPESPLYAPAITAARTGQLFTLEEMQTPDENLDAALYDAQGYSLFAYMLDRLEVQGMYAFARDIEQYESFAEAYQAAMGEAFERVVTNSERWLFTDRALQVYSVSPYIPPTLTPSATLRFSATPSHTPTRTRTATATATPSTPTATSTITPSRTPTPPPLTNTPRPPGSLNPTPAPSAEPQPAPGISPVQTVLVGGLVVTIALLVVALFRTGNNR
ncbi:MAG: hypothetical protein SF162_00025 [bacterium]|nr:hypothetical protein [bacterium]